MQYMSAIANAVNRHRNYGGVTVKKRIVFCLLCGFWATLSLWAQNNPTGTLAGAVMDPSHAAVPGARIIAEDLTTGIVLKAASDSQGRFQIANVPPGKYNVAVTAKGFRSAVFQSVAIVAGQVYDLNPVLKVGSVSSEVTVQAGAQVLHTTQTAITSTVSARVVNNVPTASSDNAMYGATLLNPAIQTIGGPRQSSAEGLPGGAVNVTIDGISAQWEQGKSGDPFFAMITPNASDVGELDMTTAAGGPQTSSGAVQVNFISQRGTNQWHGGVWDYFRNDALNSNYYFNNLAGTPRQKVRYNQWGYKVGGPILKNKLFFFTDMSIFSQPQSDAVTNTLLTPQAAQGLFTYAPPQGQMPGSASPNAWTTCDAANGTCTANLLAMAKNYGAPATIDSFVGNTLGLMQKSVTAPGVGSLGNTSLYQQGITFNENGTDRQLNPDLRLDYNINSSNSLEFDYHLSQFILSPAFLDGTAYTYPIAPFNTNQGGYYADRAIWSVAWRWTVSPTQSNDLRIGWQNSKESFFTNEAAGIYPTMSTNLGSIRMRPNFPGEITNPYLSYGPYSDWDNILQVIDNFAWVDGNHNLSFGFSYSRPTYKDLGTSNLVANVGVGLSGGEPIATQFNTTNLPGISNGDLTAAQDIYGMLVGNVTSYSASVAFDPAKRNFVTGAPTVDQYYQTNFGFYGNDSWQVEPNLTFNYGLRWQFQGAPVDQLNEYFMPANGYAGVFGVSGVNNLFKPGTLTGSVPSFVNDQGKSWYHNYYGDLAPSVGLAWEPQFGGSWWRRIFGDPGDTVLRGGYSIAYSREGMENWSSISGGNPGYYGSQYSNAIPYTQTPVAGQFAAGSVALNNMSIQSVAQDPSSFQTSFPITPSAFQAVNVVDPNLRMPMVQSWSLGIQRALSPHMALEIRYVGNHATGLWQQTNLNEVNIFQNGFLNEFKNAASNMAICQANAAACTTAQANAGVASPGAANFADWGLQGQVPLPIFTAAFTGGTADAAGAASQANPGFATNTNYLATGQAGAMANNLSSSYSYWQNIMTAGYPSNFWVVNPQATGGAYLLRNELQSTYNALVIDLRRRPLHGWTFDMNYTLAHALTNDFQHENGINFLNFTTLRDPGMNKGPSPYDIRNAFKMYSLWDLPFGPGHAWSSGNGLVRTLIGGWQFGTTMRWQSGYPVWINGGNATVNQYDSGVQLNGMSLQQVQSLLGVYKTATPAPGAVWYVPQALLGTGGQQANFNILSPCTTPGKFCGMTFLYSPSFYRADLSLMKRTQITERVRSLIEVQFLNAFNNANFIWGNTFFATAAKSIQSSGFGRIFSAYQAQDEGNDLGGRTVQLVARFSF
jgi:hypothetical protein